MTGYLCSTCQSLNLFSWDWDWQTKKKMEDGIDPSFDWSHSKLEKDRYSMYKQVQAGARSGCVFCNMLTSSFEERIARNREQNLLPLDWPAEEVWRKKWWIHLEVKVDGFDLNDSGTGGKLRFAHLKAILGWKSKNHGKYLQSYSIHGPRLMGQEYPEIYFHLAGVPGTYIASLLTSFACLQDIVAENVPSKYLGDNPTPDRRLEALKRLLSECDLHAKCRRPEEQELPTRCIQISDNAPPTLRIRETLNQRGRYLALSHRWTETTRTTKTTKANYGARVQGNDLSFQALPKVFQHTMELARDLGTDLVWIDSLCIIQEGDKEADKNHELQKMGQYYNNAYLTVAATVDPRESITYGLYPPWQGTETQVARIRARSPNGEALPGFYCIYPMSDVKKDHMKYVRKSELLTRGWVFQEWLLSRRVVSFTPRGMFLECRSSVPRNHNGVLVYDEGARFEPELRDLFLKSRFDLWNLPTSGDGILMGSRLWHRMVEIYSGVSLFLTSKVLGARGRSICLAFDEKGRSIMVSNSLWSQLGLSEPDKDCLLALAALCKVMGHVTGFAALGEEMRNHSRSPDLDINIPRGVFVMWPWTTGGLFIADSWHSLLWYPEKLSATVRTPPSQVRIKNIPTISWASVPRSIFFFDTRPEESHLYSYSESGFQEQGWLPEYGPGDGVVAETERPIAINVDESLTVNQMDLQMNINYRLEMKFAITKVLFPVRVGAPLSDAQELQRITQLAGYEALIDRCDWWTIGTTTTPHVTIGCATFEGYYPSPPLQSQLSEVSSGQQVYALGVYEEKRKTGSQVLGLVPRHQRVRTVLFLQHSKDQEYIRVGIGRLFGSEFEKLSKRTSTIRVELV